MLSRVFHGQRTGRGPQIHIPDSSASGGFFACKLLEVTLVRCWGRPIPIRLREKGA